MTEPDTRRSPARAPASAAPPGDDAPLTRYHKLLMGLLCGATVFEGFDTMLTSLALPYLAAEFGLETPRIGTIVSIVNLGTIAAFFSIRLADHYGRRPVFLFSVIGYTLLTAATAFSTGSTSFAALQFGARMLMVSELALAYVILGEELPTRFRSRGLVLLGGFAAAGAVLPALALPRLVESEWGWRGLYLLGGLLIPFLPLYWRRLRETERHLAGAESSPGRSLRAGLARSLSLFDRRFRSHTLGMTLVWFSVNFWTGASLFFFPYYAVNERGWEPSQLAILLPSAGVAGFFGFVIAGRLMDGLGRRTTLAIYLASASLASFVAYRSEADWLIGAAYVAMMMLGGLWAIGETIAVELFPTDVRATANGLCNNLLGRWGMVLAPALVGLLAARLGSTGDAVSLLGLVNLLCLSFVHWLLPETRGRALDSERD